MFVPQPLSAGALAMLAAWPAARPPLAFLQLLLGSANAALSGAVLLAILDSVDVLIAGQGRDVPSRCDSRCVGDQRLMQVCGKLMHRPAGYSLAAHTATVVGRRRALSGADPSISRSWLLSVVRALSGQIRRSVADDGVASSRARKSPRCAFRNLGWG
jgi:hypothetical protein